MIPLNMRIDGAKGGWGRGYCWGRLSGGDVRRTIQAEGEGGKRGTLEELSGHWGGRIHKFGLLWGGERRSSYGTIFKLWGGKCIRGVYS